MFIARARMLVQLTVLAAALAVVLMPTSAVQAGPMTAGNLVTVRLGNGTTTLAGGGVTGAVFLDEYTTGGTLVQSIALQTNATTTGNRALTLSGTQQFDGHITLSLDGKYLALVGYNRDAGTGGSNGDPATTTNRVIGVVDTTTGLVDTTTALQDVVSQQNVRSAYTTDGVNLWVTGSGGNNVTIGTVAGITTSGVHYTTLGSTTSVQLNTLGNTGNSRVINVFNGQLYVSNSTTSGATAPGRGANAINSAYAVPTYPPTSPAIPSTTGQNSTSLPGFTTALAASKPDDYWFKDANTLYIADGNTQAANPNATVTQTGGIQKWTFDGTNWAFQYNIGLGQVVSATPVNYVGANGLAGTVDGSGNAVLYATALDAGAAQNRLITVTDFGGAAGLPSAATIASLTTIATSPGTINGGGQWTSATANTTFKGVEIIAIPEPASLGLLASAGLMLLARRRRH